MKSQIQLSTREVVNLDIYQEDPRFHWYRIVPDHIDQTLVIPIIDMVLYNLDIATYIKDGRPYYKEEFILELACPNRTLIYDSGNKVYVQKDVLPYVMYQGLKLIVPHRRYLTGYKCSQELGYTYIFTTTIGGDIIYPKYMYKCKLYNVLDIQ